MIPCAMPFASMIYRKTTRAAATTTRMTTVVPTTVTMWRQPNEVTEDSDVPRPSAEMAISRPSVEASTSQTFTPA